MLKINGIPLDEFCDYWVEDSEQYVEDDFSIEECVNDLVEAAKVIKQLLESIEYWSYCTRKGMLTHCPEKDNELKEFYESLDIYPA